MVTAIASWLEAHQTFAIVMVGLSVVLAIGTAAALPWLVAALPRDFFSTEAPAVSRWAEHHPVIRWTIRVLKNLLGAVLVVVGVGLLALPGQGLLTIAVGVVLLEFPGKRRLERWVARRRSVWRALNWVRRRMGREEFAEEHRER